MEPSSCLAEFEPDPGVFDFPPVEVTGREADGLDWIDWDDADGELSWAADELRHIAPDAGV